MQSHFNKPLSLTEKFSSKCNNKICSISTFAFLHFSCHDYHFCGRMLDFQLLHDCRSIRCHKDLIQMVDYHLLHSLLVFAKKQDYCFLIVMLILNIFLPFGPRDVLVMFEISLHALIFFNKASSKPEKCLWPYYQKLHLSNLYTSSDNIC